MSLTRKNKTIMIVDTIGRIQEPEKIKLFKPEGYFKLKYGKKSLKKKIASIE